MRPKDSTACICIFAYKKFYSLKNLLNSLQCLNNLSSVDILFFQDAPINTDVQKLILEFAERNPNTIYFPRSYNYGLKNNILAGLLHCSQHYSKTIVLEDDLLISKNILGSLDIDLEYLDRNQIAQVSLYSWEINDNTGTSFYPVHFGYDAYFTKIPVSWGFWMSSKMISDFLRFHNHNPEIHEDTLQQLPDQCHDWLNNSWKLHLWKYIIHNNKYVLNYVTGYSTVSATNLGANQSLSDTFTTQLDRDQTVTTKYLPDFPPSDWFYDQWFEVDGAEFRRRSGLSKDVIVNLYNTKPEILLENHYLVGPINYQATASQAYYTYTIPHEMSLIETAHASSPTSAGRQPTFYLSKFDITKHDRSKIYANYIRGNILHKKFIYSYLKMFVAKLFKR